MRLPFLWLPLLLASDTQLDYLLDTIKDWSEALGEIGALAIFAAMSTVGPGGTAASASDFDELKRAIKEHIEFQVDFFQTDILLKGI